jgi:hypothetical protein
MDQPGDEQRPGSDPPGVNIAPRMATRKLVTLRGASLDNPPDTTPRRPRSCTPFEDAIGEERPMGHRSPKPWGAR